MVVVPEGQCGEFVGIGVCKQFVYVDPSRGVARSCAPRKLLGSEAVLVEVGRVTYESDRAKPRSARNVS